MSASYSHLLSAVLLHSWRGLNPTCLKMSANLKYKIRFVPEKSRGVTMRHSSTGSKEFLHIHDEVKQALLDGTAVVALESTILTHGMPYPSNLNMAQSVEKIIRAQGAVPATIAIIQGKACVGLSLSQLSSLAEGGSGLVKVSRRDVAYSLAKGLNGGTTISGTMMLAHLAGIEIFVSGGLGGVHRGGEITMDVSADLTELGRTPVAVVTSGVKSILDIGRTLEYLETQGVCVATFGPCKEFPAFFTENSGFQSPYSVSSADDAADLIEATFSIKSNGGLLLAVPIPKESQMDGDAIELAIQMAVREAEEKSIRGKDITPYILERVNQLTAGKSLEANIALIINNAKVGAEIACRLAEKRKIAKHQLSNQTVSRVVSPQPTANPSRSRVSSSKTPVVIGGSILDGLTRISDPSFKVNGATYDGKVYHSYGGVGRNLADALTRLGSFPKFLTAIGNDFYGAAMMKGCLHMDWSLAHISQTKATATYNGILDYRGDVVLGVGDMDIHKEITPHYIESHADLLSQASIVCIDGNLTLDSMELIGNICSRHSIPVFYEPTNVDKACKPYSVGLGDSLKFIKPNLQELEVMVENITGLKHHITDDTSLSELAQVGVQMVRTVPNVIITLGARGSILCLRKPYVHVQPLSSSEVLILQNTEDAVVCHFDAIPTDHICSVSGAGDCFGAAFIHGVLLGIAPDLCMRIAHKAAWYSLQTYSTVPEELTPALYSEDRAPQLYWYRTMP